MYGPVAGGGFVERSCAGVPVGTSDAQGVARMFEKSPCGAFSVTSMVPAASSVLMPEISPFLVLENSSAPTMPVKKPTPGEFIRNRRLIEYAKSLALTGLPSE